jgi:hypothetical protein
VIVPGGGVAAEASGRRGRPGGKRNGSLARVARAIGVPGVGVGDGEPEVRSTQVKVVWRIQWLLICWVRTQGGAASGYVCPVDNSAESFVVGVVVAPDDVPADHAGLLFMCGVVGSVECEVPQGCELRLYAV